MQTCHELPAAISATSSVEAPRPQYGGDFSAHIGVHFLKKERRLRNVMWRRRRGPYSLCKFAPTDETKSGMKGFFFRINRFLRFAVGVD
jgi:hypothetical protein